MCKLDLVRVGDVKHNRGSEGQSWVDLFIDCLRVEDHGGLIGRGQTPAGVAEQPLNACEEMSTLIAGVGNREVEKAKLTVWGLLEDAAVHFRFATPERLNNKSELPIHSGIPDAWFGLLCPIQRRSASREHNPSYQNPPFHTRSVSTVGSEP